MGLGVIINILSFSHPHVKSLFREGLWGFPDDKPGMNRRRWDRLEAGVPVLIYGEYNGVRGIWFSGEVIDKFISHDPVKYWVKNQTGYPYQVRLRFKFPHEKLSMDVLTGIRPVYKDELASIYGIRIFKAKVDRWSLLVFGDVKEEGVTYSYTLFKKVLDEFIARNRVISIDRPVHEKIKEIVYQIGIIQGRNPEKEYPIENKRIDVVWRRTPKSVPSVAFEIQLGGNLYEALSKLKHAYDLWNSIPVLITTSEQINEARKWIEGSFHEVKDVFRVVSWEKIKNYYDIKRKAKEIEIELKIA